MAAAVDPVDVINVDQPLELSGFHAGLAPAARSSAARPRSSTASSTACSRRCRARCPPPSRAACARSAAPTRRSSTSARARPRAVPRPLRRSSRGRPEPQGPARRWVSDPLEEFTGVTAGSGRLHRNLFTPGCCLGGGQGAHRWSASWLSCSGGPVRGGDGAERAGRPTTVAGTTPRRRPAARHQRGRRSAGRRRGPNRRGPPRRPRRSASSTSPPCSTTARRRPRAPASCSPRPARSSPTTT